MPWATGKDGGLRVGLRGFRLNRARLKGFAGSLPDALKPCAAAAGREVAAEGAGVYAVGAGQAGLLREAAVGGAHGNLQGLVECGQGGGPPLLGAIAGVAWLRCRIVYLGFVIEWKP